MNYIRQKIAFRELKNTLSIKGSYQSVYDALLDIANIQKWKEEFEVDYGFALSLCQVDKSTYYKAIDFFVENGLIKSYTKGVNHYARAKVVLNVLYEKSESISDTNDDLDSDLQCDLSQPISESKPFLLSDLSQPISEQYIKGKQNLNNKHKTDTQNLFLNFWDLYQKKNDKAKAMKIWKTLSADIHAKIIEMVPAYVKSTPDQKYRKNPVNYLKDESWENEIINPNKNMNTEPVRYVTGQKPIGAVSH